MRSSLSSRLLCQRSRALPNTAATTLRATPAARATSPAAGQDTVPLVRFKPQIELKQAVFCRLVSCGTPRDQELGKPIHAGPSLSVLRPAARLQFGSYFGKALGTLADFPANLVADAAEIAEPDAIDGKQLLDGVHTHAVEHITRLDAVAELGDGAAAVETAGDGFNAVLCDSAAIQWLERAPPFAEHVLGVAEALFSIPAQGLREKVPQPLAKRRIEAVRRNRGLVLSDEGLRRAIAPNWRDARNKLVQRNGGGVSLSMQIPAALGPQR